MIHYQNTFRRYEIKYRINAAQKAAVLEAISPYMKLDSYGRTTVRNLYFDTDDFRIIRRSLEKPTYKEKLRLRTYAQALPESPVFVELKKKYKSVVYKRRLVLSEREVTSAFADGRPLPVESQIGDEIQYFREFYPNLKARVFLSYEREAYYATDGGDLRITFDENILYRTTDLSLTSPPDGIPILGDGETLLEIKTAGAIPLWLTEVLTKHCIFKTSFSKYGMAYTDMLNNVHKGDIIYV